MDLAAVNSLADRIASRLSTIPGIEAIALGGSWGRGEGRTNSNIDLGLYYDPLQPPALAALQDAARELDDRHADDLLTDFGEWGPWINGGAWLQIDGQRVDWLYRDLALVRRVLTECQDGQPTIHYQPGYPHGFHSPIYLGEVHGCRPLFDPNGTLAALKTQLETYPTGLKSALMDGLWEAEFSLEMARKSAQRGEVFYVAGCLFRSVAILVQVLFALNEQYFTNEKGAVERIGGFASRPLRFVETVSAVLAKPGFTPHELEHSIQRLGELVSETHELVTQRLPVVEGVIHGSA